MGIKKCFNDFLNKCEMNKIIKYLEKQNIQKLTKDSNEAKVIQEVREYYANNFNYNYLNSKLIELENLRFNRNKFANFNYYVAIVSVLISLIACFISLSDSVFKIYLVKVIGAVGCFALFIIGSSALETIFAEAKNNRLHKSINIHIRVINEQLKKIEEEKQKEIEGYKKEQNKQLIQEFKETQKILLEISNNINQKETEITDKLNNIQSNIERIEEFNNIK